MKVYVLIVLAALCAGCASQKAWYRDQTSVEQALDDLADCRFNAGKNAGGSGAQQAIVGGSGAQQASNSMEKVNSCMQSKGYDLVNKADFEKDNNNK